MEPFDKVSPFSTPPLKPPSAFPKQNKPIEFLLSYSPKGRMGRLSLLTAMVTLILALGIISLVLMLALVVIVPGLMGDITTASRNHLLGPTGFGIYLVLGIAILGLITFFIYSSIFYVRRLHDFNRSGWWVLLIIIPEILRCAFSGFGFVGAGTIAAVTPWLWNAFFLVLFIVPGSKGVNRFGQPRLTPLWEKVFGLISVAIVLTVSAIGRYIHSDLSGQHPTDTKLLVTPHSVNSTASKYKAPYPFTAQELWDKLLKITALSDGYISQAQIETALGTSLHVDADMISYSKDPALTTTAGVNWYFGLRLIPSTLFGQSSSQLYFDWADSSIQAPPDGMCINANDIKSSLFAQGWIVDSKDNEDGVILSRSEYKKGKDKAVSFLVISFDPTTRCIMELRLSAPTKLHQ